MYLFEVKNMLKKVNNYKERIKIDWEKMLVLYLKGF